MRAPLWGGPAASRGGAASATTTTPHLLAVALHGVGGDGDDGRAVVEPAPLPDLLRRLRRPRPSHSRRSRGPRQHGRRTTAQQGIRRRRSAGCVSVRFACGRSTAVARVRAWGRWLRMWNIVRMESWHGRRVRGAFFSVWGGVRIILYAGRGAGGKGKADLPLVHDGHVAVLQRVGDGAGGGSLRPHTGAKTRAQPRAPPCVRARGASWGARCAGAQHAAHPSRSRRTSVPLLPPPPPRARAHSFLLALPIPHPLPSRVPLARAP